MSFSSIQGTPAQINLFFVNVDNAPPPAPHPLGGVAGVLLRAVLEAQLPAAAATALDQLLSTPLDQIFDQAWSGLQGMAQSMVQQAVLSAMPGAYDINTTVPPKGALSAQVSGLSPGMLSTLPPGTAGQQLTLNYSLPGFRVSFSKTTSGIWGSWADPSYNLTFDGALELDIAVPSQAFVPLGAKAEFLTTNMQAGAGNAFAVLAAVTDAIVAWLTSSTGGGGSLPDTITAISIPALEQLLTQLSSGFAAAAAFGFLQLGVQINENPPAGTPAGTTLEFDLTHPFDPAPVVFNALTPSGPHFVIPPVLSASMPAVNAGGTLGLVGSSFPSAQATQLVIGWTDTTSGNIVESEVQWGIVASGQAPPLPADLKDVTFPRHSYDNANTFTASGVVPSTSYAFRVRDFDVKDFIATAWSDWKVLTTAASDQVQLVLSYNDTLLGFAQLQTGGSFSTTVIIPTSVPAGTYTLWATLSGQQMAQTTIVVVAQGQALGPVLQLINPQTNAPLTGTPLILTASPVPTNGLHFAPGTVDLFVDSAAGASLGSVTADASGSFTTMVTWPYGVTGPHSIWAQQNALSAQAPVWAENPPK